MTIRIFFPSDQSRTNALEAPTRFVECSNGIATAVSCHTARVGALAPVAFETGENCA